MFTIEIVADERLMLTEVLSTDHLMTFAQQMPQVHHMLTRLRPKVASDPFVTASGVRLSDRLALR